MSYAATKEFYANNDVQTFPQFDSVFDKIARMITLVSVFCLAFSPTMNDLFMLAALISLAGGQFKQRLQVIFTYRMSFLLLAFLALAFISVAYGQAQWAKGIHYFNKYFFKAIASLLLIPLFMDAHWRKRLLNVLFSGALLSIVLYVCQFFQLFNWIVFVHKTLKGIFPPIPYSLFIALVSFFVLNRVVEAKSLKSRLCYLTMFLVMAWWVFFVNHERTGMLVLLALITLFFWQQFALKGLLYGGIIVSVLVLGLYHFSTTFHDRTKLAFVNAAHVSATTGSSTGLRINYIKYGLQLASNKPWLGYGIAAFTNGGTVPVGSTMDHHTRDPENSFLQVQLQMGILGAIVFVAWLLMQLYETSCLPMQERYLAQGLICGMMLASICVSAFIINLSAVTYFILLGMLFSARYDTASYGMRREQ